MRRISKREIGFRFGMIDEARVRIDRLERGHAVATLAGVECQLNLRRSERQDLAKKGSMKAFVNSYTTREGDGWLPKGTRPDETGIDELFGKPPKKAPVFLQSEGFNHDSNRNMYENFARLHPVGSMVEAEVIDRYSDKVRIRFEGSVHSRMSMRDYVDRWPLCRRADLGNMRWLNRIEVIVRRIDLQRHVVVVSMHGYPKDGRYCNASAGYRSSYDASEGMFRLLPWQR